MSEELKKRAEEIRDETAREANTAERVGGVLVSIVTECDEAAGLIDKSQEELQAAVNELTERVGELKTEIQELREKLEEFMGLTYISAIEVPAEGGGAVLGVKTMCKEWEVE